MPASNGFMAPWVYPEISAQKQGVAVEVEEDIGSQVVLPGYQRHGSKGIGQQWVHGTIYLLDLRCARRLEPRNLSMKTGCCSGS